MSALQPNTWGVEYSLDSDLTLTIWPEDQGQLDPGRHFDEFDLVEIIKEYCRYADESEGDLVTQLLVRLSGQIYRHLHTDEEDAL